MESFGDWDSPATPWIVAVPVADPTRWAALQMPRIFLNYNEQLTFGFTFRHKPPWPHSHVSVYVKRWTDCHFLTMIEELNVVALWAGPVNFLANDFRQYELFGYAPWMEATRCFRCQGGTSGTQMGDLKPFKKAFIGGSIV